MWSPQLCESSKENTEKNNLGKWYGPRTPIVSTRTISRSPQESPRLSLALFANTPRISLGKVKIGQSKIKMLVVENPMSIAQSLHLDKSSGKKGFTFLTPVEHGERLRMTPDGNYEVLSCCDEFTVPAMSEVDLPILWEPEIEGSFRETITLKLGDFNRLHLIVFGNAIDTAPKPKHKMKTLLPDDVRKGHLPSQKRKISTYDNVATKKVLQESNRGLPQPSNKKPTKIEKQVKGTEKKKRTLKIKVAAKGVAPSRLKLIKKSTEQSRNIPRHPLPYAAKNMYFDEKWIEKQERGFVQWLNYILTPPDEFTSVVASPETSSLFIMENADQEQSQPLAPTKEVLSFRTYTARRKMARLRRSACLLYESQPVTLVTRTIEREVGRNRLCIRPDKHFHQDLGIKETIVKMLLSYNPLWLRIGLETIYGEILPLQSNNDAAGLKRFLKSRFLANPDIANEYRHATVAEYYKPGYFEALNKFTLKKFLLLVLFLDKAKLTRLIDHDPCLFNKDARYKCSRDLLLSFSRDYLKGEGDVTKHLSFLNYTVSHLQAPLDEMDYAVTNLAVDLRDGLRITRVIELLTQNWTLSSTLRVPAVSRLQKIYNVGVALSDLNEREIFEDEKDIVDPRHIVDGHREKTLSFLWSIILHFQVNLVVNENQLEEEIVFLRRYANRQKYFKSRVSCSEVHQKSTKEEEQDIYFKSTKLRLLLEWCRSVCLLYGIKVDNFTVSMSDGRVLCYLVHYYHPCLLKEEDICQDTTQTCNSYIAEDDSLNDSLASEKDMVTSYDAEYGTEGEGKLSFLELKENERKNHELCREKVQELGGVPCLLKFTDMSSTIPDEKVVITYVSYLCARLLDLREEGRAAITIQLAWRRHCFEKHLKEVKRKTKAALVIQKYFRCFQKKKQEMIEQNSILTIQAFFRGYQARRDLGRRQSAATIIQLAYRSLIATRETQRDYRNLKETTLRTQALVRGKIARGVAKKMRAARVIQCHWRGCLARDRFLKMKKSTIVVQAVIRRFLIRRRYKTLRTATVVIQRRYKSLKLARNTKHGYTKLKKVVTTVQALRRGIKARREVRQLRAVIVLQKTFRMWRCRLEFLEVKKMIIKMESLVRRNIAQRKYRKAISSVRVIQQRWRAHRLGELGKKSYLQRKACAVTVQSLYRTRIARQRFLAKRNAAILIQACTRGYLARKELEIWRKSCRVIQKYYRAYSLMKEIRSEFGKKKETAMKLQALYKGRRSRCEYQRQRKAVVSAQARVRGQLARRKYLKVKSSVGIIETRYLALKMMRCERKSYLDTRHAVATLQASLRGYLVREQLRKMNVAATLVQTNYRKYIARVHYLHVQRCVLVIQSRYRAWSVGNEIAADYKELRNAVLVIQKHTRGYAVRKEIRSMSEAAMKIQATFRGYRSKKAYTTVRSSVLIIQRNYRALRLTRNTREDYVRKRACVIILQSSLRRMLCVREFQRKKTAARVIQTRWRASLVSRQMKEEYYRVRRSIIIVQALFRGCNARREVKKERAVIKVQSCWRGVTQRRAFLQLRQATVFLQSCIRMVMERQRYMALKQCVVSLQRKVRANQMCMRQKLIYGITCGAIVTLQAAYRGIRARKELQRTKEATIKIQASFRRYHTRLEYLKIRRSVVLLQHRRRATVESRLIRVEYENLKRSVVLLQSLARGRAARRQYQESREKIVKLQAAVRGFLARREYLRMCHAAMVIQQHYRAFVLGTAWFFWYNIQKGACITIQAHTKAWIQRQRYFRLKKATQVIQVYYRTWKTAKKQRDKYQRLRSAVISIQAYTRGWSVRHHLQRSRAATRIQSWWKMFLAREGYQRDRRCMVRVQSVVRAWLARRRYKNLVRATIIIQRRSRANQACRNERDLFLEKKGSCLLIQHCYRYYRQRRLVENMLQSVSKIRAAVLVIQQRYRAKQLMRSERENYLTQRHAVTTLQAAYRGYKARVLVARLRATVVIQSYYRGYRQCCEYTRLREAVVKIQAFARGKQANRAYRNLRHAAVVIQRRERARVQGNSERTSFLEKRNSAVVIQCCVRGYRERVRYQKLRNATIKAQSLVRGKLTREAYGTLRWATVVIQRRERARVLGNSERKVLLEKRNSAVVIQCYWRSYRERERYQKLRNAVIKVQALVRGKLTRKAYRTLRWATVVIQRRERARVLGNSERKVLLEKRNSAVVIQCYWRGYRERERYQKLRNAIIKVQALVRGKLTREAYRTLRWATVVIQRRERARVLGNSERKVLLEKRNSAVVIQCYWRGYRERERYQKLRNATIKVQALVRGKLTREAYGTLRWATVVIQRRERARVLGNSERKVLLEKRNSAVVIQCYWRGYRERERYQKLRNATIKVQALVRGKLTREAYGTLRWATVVIQRRERARVLGNSERKVLLEKRNSAVVIQCYWRGYRERERYQKLRNATIKVQALVRGKLTREAYGTLRWATVVIQRRERARVLGKFERKVFLKQKESAVLIQSWLRGNHERTRYVRVKNAATRIQAWVRGRSARVAFENTRRAAVVIQRRERARVLGKTQRKLFLEQRKNAVLIQSHVRAHQQRTRYLDLRDATTKIQARVRGRRARIAFRKLRDSTVVIQRRERARILGKTTRNFYLSQKKCAVLIQSWLRGCKTRQNIRRIRAAQLIQQRYRACVRGRRARDDFVAMRMAAITVQTWYRGYVARKEFKDEKAARVIQAYVRGHQARMKVEEIKREKATRLLRFSAAVHINIAAIRLQRAYRKAKVIALFKARMDRLLFIQRWWRAKMERLRFLRVKYLLCVMQTRWRVRFAIKNQAAAKIQALARTLLAKREAERRKEAILTLQSFWRGYQVRKQSKSGKIKKARQRVRSANANATERMKLCNRTRSALDYLLKCKNLSTVLGALVNLEVATRLSHKCTEQLVLDNALSVIFKVVQNSNRSLAHIELIKHALGIFVNVAKCPTTQGVVVTREPGSLDTLVELACIFREKPEIFLRTCVLLTLLCENEEIRENLLSMQKAVNKLRSVYTLTKRKYELGLKRNNAKSKALNSSARDTKQTMNNKEASPLSVITTLVHVLGLFVK